MALQSLIQRAKQLWSLDLQTVEQRASQATAGSLHHDAITPVATLQPNLLY